MEVRVPNRMDSPINCQRQNDKASLGDISPYEHLLQIYENECVLLDTLESFVIAGFELGEGVVLIATAQRLKAIEERLLKRGIDLEAACTDDEYVPLEAEATLAKFMRHNLPDPELFKSLILELLNRARGRSWRRVRAFGEMVVLLWSQGNPAATIQLEHLWHDLCKAERFSLLCAYPLKGFKRDASRSIERIRAIHSNEIAGQADLD